MAQGTHNSVHERMSRDIRRLGSGASHLLTCTVSYHYFCTVTRLSFFRSFVCVFSGCVNRSNSLENPTSKVPPQFFDSWCLVLPRLLFFLILVEKKIKIAVKTKSRKSRSSKYRPYDLYRVHKLHYITKLKQAALVLKLYIHKNKAICWRKKYFQTIHSNHAGISCDPSLLCTALQK